MKNKTFTIEVTMNGRWVNDFCSMLHWMQSCGNLGHSSLVGFYADGDGDFRPKFTINTEWEKTKLRVKSKVKNIFKKRIIRHF